MNILRPHPKSETLEMENHVGIFKSLGTTDVQPRWQNYVQTYVTMLPPASSRSSRSSCLSDFFICKWMFWEKYLQDYNPLAENSICSTCASKCLCLSQWPTRETMAEVVMVSINCSIYLSRLPHKLAWLAVKAELDFAYLLANIHRVIFVYSWKGSTCRTRVLLYKKTFTLGLLAPLVSLRDRGEKEVEKWIFLEPGSNLSLKETT